MAFTIQGTPDIFSPAFNPIFFYIDSTNKNLEGHRYLVDIYSASTSTRIAPFNLIRRPVDGYCVADINQILATKVSCFLNQDLNNFSICPQNWVNYDIQIGEEYVQYIPFDIPSNFLGYQAYSSSTSTNSFVTGEELVFSGNVAAVNGTYTVLLTGQNYVVFDSPYDSASSAVTSATMVYSNHRRTAFRALSGSSGWTAFNGAVGHQDLLSYTSSTYNMIPGSGNALFLTNCPDDYTVRRSNKMWLNYYTTSNSYVLYLKVTTNNGVYLLSNPLTVNAAPMFTVACGPYNLENWSGASPTVVSGSLPMFDANTTEYSVQLVGFEETFTNISEVKTFTVKQTCSRYTNVELYFIDRLGSIIPVNFELNSVRSMQVKKSEYQTLLGDLAGSKWSFDSTQAGNNTINTIAIEQMEINTDFQTEDEAYYFRELISSPKVWIKEYGKLWPVIIRTTDLPILTKNNKKNINQRILIEYANKNTIQNI